MTDGPLFSVVTATLNSGATVERCVRSVITQTFSDWEHLIVDGGSSDRTVEVVKKYVDSTAVRLVRSAPDLGIYDAWNYGITHAKGEWILFLGSDDTLAREDVLERVHGWLVHNSEMSHKNFLYGDTLLPFAGIDWKKFRERPWLDRLRGATNFPASVFIRRSLFEDGARYDASYRVCADHKFFAQNNFHRNAAYISFLIIRFSAGGVSNRPENRRIIYQERKRMLAELGRSRPFWVEPYYWARSFI